MNTSDPTWFRGATVYQIYPRSFYDANGDGVGDLAGVIEKLDYLNNGRNDGSSLGVDAIWLSPFYRSPMADFGYDVSDYCDVDPIFGSLADFDRLVAEAHRRGIKVMIDFVPNHSSDQHPWFVESRSSKTNPKRDWYIWRDAKSDGSLPNNWESLFGGPVWQLDELTGQYYLHTFLAEQPDLNWANPDVREAMKDQMRFWLDRGIDGFRVDAVWWISKDAGLRDDPADGSETNSRSNSKLYDYLHEMSNVVKEYPGGFMVIEASPIQRETPAPYLPLYHRIDPNVTAPFNFEGIHMKWDAQVFKRFIDRFQAAMGPKDIPIYVLGNHDKPRLASRIGDAATRTAAVMLLTLPGTPFIYNGEEIGMHNGVVPPDRAQDPVEKRGATAEKSRDGERTPLQWSDAPQAGFSTAQPWLPVAGDYASRNIAGQLQDPGSLLSLYRQLTRLRRASDVLRLGEYRALATSHPAVFGFRRQYKGQELVVILNFSDQDLVCATTLKSGHVRLSSYLDSPVLTDPSQIALRPNEGMIIQL